MHLHSRLVTVHGLDFGIPAEMTVFSGLAELVYNDERGSVGTIKACKRSRMTVSTVCCQN